MNNKENFNQMSKPPLGPRPDFDKIDRENNERMSKLDYISVANYPELQAALEVASAETNNIRKKIGLEEILFDISKIRLIKKEIWLENENITYDKGGFIDSRNRISYIELLREDLENDLPLKIDTLHGTTHEYVHSSMDGGISKYSFYLNEGITDLLTKNILKKVMPDLLPDEKTEEYVKFSRDNSLDGLEIRPDDLLLVRDGEALVFYPYIPQMRLLEALDCRYPGLLVQLIEFAFKGDNNGAEEIMIQRCGDDVARIVKSRFWSAREMIKRI